MSRDLPTRTEARGHLVLALDVGDAAAAVALVRRFSQHFGVAKVGLELFVAEGPEVVRAVLGEGVDVLLDLKLHDIPTTVARAAANAAATGARYVTTHAAGGRAMLEAAVTGYAARSRIEGGAARSGVIAVTVLTSDLHAPATLLGERAVLASEAGCTGVVCASPDLEVVSAAAPGLLTLVPGIRLPGAATDDQARVATPRQAFERGADLLVIGRTVTAAPDPEAAAAAIVANLSDGEI